MYHQKSKWNHCHVSWDSTISPRQAFHPPPLFEPALLSPLPPSPVSKPGTLALLVRSESFMIVLTCVIASLAWSPFRVSTCVMALRTAGDIAGAGIETATRAGTEAEIGAMAGVALSPWVACLAALQRDYVSLQCLQIHHSKGFTFPPNLDDDY